MNLMGILKFNSFLSIEKNGNDNDTFYIDINNIFQQFQFILTIYLIDSLVDILPWKLRYVVLCEYSRQK